MPPIPCTYKTKNNYLQPITTICGKVCDAGETLCPRHIVVTQAEADELRRRERKREEDRKEEARKAKFRAGARR